MLALQFIVNRLYITEICIHERPMIQELYKSWSVMIYPFPIVTLKSGIKFVACGFDY